MRITISKFSFREHVKKQQYLLLAICANFLSKIEKFKLEVAGCICLQKYLYKEKIRLKIEDFY